MTNRRRFFALAGSVLLTLPVTSSWGQSTPRRMGWLSPFPRADVESFKSLLRSDLEKLGWIEGRNIAFLEPRLADGRNERLPALATELVAQAPDVILVQSAPATRALMQATKTIPLVMLGVGNPVEYGIVAELARPGGNVTGSAFLAVESILKLLQLLREAAPRVRSVAVFSNPTNEAAAPMNRQIQAAAASRGVRVQVVEVSGPDDFDEAFAAVRSEKTESLLLPPEPLIRSKRDAVGGFALRHGLPLGVVGGARILPAGGLIGYSPSFAAFPQLTARYVDRLLKGAKPGELAVEQPTRFELTVNLKTARALGLTLPASLLASADELIQ
jgi:putative ABC transport system substrate-binding protein